MRAYALVYTLVLATGLTWALARLAPGTAVAQPGGGEDADAKAAARFQRAVELYREGSYEGALAEFRKAYQISPAYRVIYNIAQSQYAMHDFVGAYKSLVEYMTEGSGEIPADRRIQVDEMFAKLRERIAQLQISTNVAGAEIRVDDVAVGISPLPGLIAVNGGTRRISAFKPGSPEAVRVVTVAGKETVKIDLAVNERLEQLSAKSAPFGPVAVASETGSRSPSTPSPAPYIAALSVTGALAAGTAVFGYLALAAQRDLNNQVNTFPNTPGRIEDARTRSRDYGYITDGFGAATLVGAGTASYLVLAYRGEAKARRRKMLESVALAPIAAPGTGGMVLTARF